MKKSSKTVAARVPIEKFSIIWGDLKERVKVNFLCLSAGYFRQHFTDRLRSNQDITRDERNALVAALDNLLSELKILRRRLKRVAVSD